jgi:hypothetical protein
MRSVRVIAVVVVGLAASTAALVREEAHAAPAVAPSHRAVSLPEGVSAAWWDAVRQSLEAAEYRASPGATPGAPRGPWRAEGNRTIARFGWSVGTAGDVNGDGYADVIVGAAYYDNGQYSEGQAFVFHGSAAGLSATPDWTAESDQLYAHFGWSVGTAGDVNGDGYADVIVGAWGYRNGGGAFVYHGSPAGLSTTPNWTAESDQNSAFFGESVGTAGDVNGDGYADVIVGAPNYDNGQPDEGRAFVYHGSAAGLSTSPDWTAESNRDFTFFATAVGTAGDVNGGGYADVIVGASDRALVYHGSAAGLSTTADWTIDEGPSFGDAVGTAGDVNGDGFADAIVGEWAHKDGQNAEGGAFVYHGSAAGLSTSPDWAAESNQEYAYFGWSVGTAGDVNGDGYADVIAGAYKYDTRGADEGKAFVYHGSAAGLSTTPGWTGGANQQDAHFGYSVGTAGDVNGDGYADFIVGAPDIDHGQEDEGAAYVYRGRAS